MMRTVDICVCCGDPVPEGRQVCWACEHMKGDAGEMGFELTMGGYAMGGIDAISTFERLAEFIPSEQRQNYDRALNRFRYEVDHAVAIEPKIAKGRFTSYSCGKCGHGVDPADKYCPACGKLIKWR